HDLGLRTGDRLVAINGEPLERFEEIFTKAIAPNGFVMTINRDGDLIDIPEPDGFLTRVTEVLRNAESPDALGLSYMPSLLGGVVADAPAKQAGLQRGDRIVAIDGTPVDYFEQLRSIITESEGRTLVVNFRRPDSLADGEPEATLIADGDGYKEWQTGLTPEEITFGD